MKIQLKRSELAPALTTVAAVVERRQTLPILSNLLIETQDDALVLTATNLELQISARIPASILQAGRITLPAKKFADICRALPEDGQIEIEVKQSRAIVRSGRSYFSLSTLPAEDYPSLEANATEDSFAVGRDILYRLIEHSSFAMAHQDVRYYLNGMLLIVTTGKIIAVATDGHRLAKVEAETQALDSWPQERSVILPAKTVTELKRLLNNKGAETCQMELGESAIVVKMENTIITSKLIDGRYPDYERVIPRNLNHLAKIDRETLKNALTRMSVLSYEKQKGVRMTFAQDTLKLEVSNPEQEEAEESIAVEYPDEETTIGFNVAYWLDVLNVIEGKWICAHFIDAEASTILTDPESEGELYVVMPMRI